MFYTNILNQAIGVTAVTITHGIAAGNGPVVCRPIMRGTATTYPAAVITITNGVVVLQALGAGNYDVECQVIYSTNL